jgi:hypothetical protein
LLESHSDSARAACRGAGDAACQAEFAHAVELYDVGVYRFKGVAYDFCVKSVGAGALRGRAALYGELKSAKAKKVSDGAGFEQASAFPIGSRARGLCSLLWQRSRLRGGKTSLAFFIASTHCRRRCPCVWQRSALARTSGAVRCRSRT